MLAVIESPETDKQYLAAVADAHNKQLIANRAATLVKKEMISQQDADQAEADAAVSKANLEQIGTLKSYEELRAPFSGTVTARYSDPGALIQNAATSQTSALPLVEISETSRLRIYVYVDQAHAPFVRNGDEVTILDQTNPNLKVGGAGHAHQRGNRSQDADSAGGNRRGQSAQPHPCRQLCAGGIEGGDAALR